MQQSIVVLNEIQSRQLLLSYGIRQNRYGFADTKEKALQISEEMTKPLVMKVVSKKIIHKTDFGGVQVGLTNRQEIEQAFDTIYENAMKKNVKFEEIEGVSIQEQVFGVQEMLLGMKRDPVFGPVILIGLGGVLVELMKDVSIGICELEERDIYQMLYRLKGFPLLDGYRGRKKADVTSFVQLIKQVQEMVLKDKDIQEMDLNPVIVKEEGHGSIVVDARIVIKHSL